MPVNIERGFRRLTWVISILLGLPIVIYGIIEIAVDLVDGIGGDGGIQTYFVVTLLFIVIAAAAFAVPWGVFFLIRWIVLGFRSAPTPEDSVPRN